MTRAIELVVPISLLSLCVRPVSPFDARNVVTPAESSNLSPCVLSCFQPIFEQYECNLDKPCFCQAIPVYSAIEACLGSNCSVQDQLEAQKFRAEECSLPTHDDVESSNATIWTVFAFACAFAILRLFNRCPSIGGAGYWWDDHTLWLTCLPMITLIALGHVAREHGIGKDAWDSNLGDITKALKLSWTGEIFYLLTVYGTKISFLLLYLRIWNGNPTIRLLCWAGIGILGAALITFEFATIFQCSIVSYNGTAFPGTHGSCDNGQAQTYTNAALDIIFDVAILLLPVRVLLRLEFTVANKLGLCFVFLVGWAVVICACLRLNYLIKFADHGESNITLYSNYVGLWSNLEALLGVICACIPTSAGLAHRLLDRIRDETASRHVEESDEKNLTVQTARTLRTSAYANNSSLAVDVESGVERGLEETWSGSNASAAPRVSESSGDMEQIANTFHFQDRTMPAVEEQRRKAAAKKVVAEILRNLEREQLGRGERSSCRPSAGVEHGRPSDDDTTSISSLDEGSQPEIEAQRTQGHEGSMLPCEEPTPPVEAASEREKERASASSGVEPTTKYQSERPGMDGRRLSSRSAQSESAAGSTHAFFDNVNAEPFFTDISPEEARHRDDLQEFQAWRTIVPSAIPLRDEDVGRTSRDKRRAQSRSRTRSSRGLRRSQSNSRSISSQDRTRPSSCGSSGDVLEPRSPLKRRSQVNSTLYDGEPPMGERMHHDEPSIRQSARYSGGYRHSTTFTSSTDIVEHPAPSKVDHRSSNPAPSASIEQSATYEPSADLAEPPAPFEVEHRHSEPSPAEQYQQQSRRVPLGYFSRRLPPRNSDGSASTNDDLYQCHGVSLSFEGEQKWSESNTPADDMHNPIPSPPTFVSPYTPKEVYRNSDGSASTAASDQYPLRSQGISDKYDLRRHSTRDSYFQPQHYQFQPQSYKDDAVSPFTPSPHENNGGSASSPVVSPLKQKYEVRPDPTPIQHTRPYSFEEHVAEYASSIESVPRTSDEESTVRPSTANRAPSGAFSKFTQQSNGSHISTKDAEDPTSSSSSYDPRSPHTPLFDPDVHLAFPDQQRPSTAPSPAPSSTNPSTTSIMDPEAEKERRRHAAETVFKLVAASRDAAEQYSSSSNSSGERPRPRNKTRRSAAAGRMLDFHERSRLFDEEQKRKRALRRAASYGMEGRSTKQSKAGVAAVAGSHVLSPGRNNGPPSVSKLKVGDGRELVIGREQIDLCHSD